MARKDALAAIADFEKALSASSQPDASKKAGERLQG